MKILRRRRHLRPRPSRSQRRQQLDHLRRQLYLFRVEWLLEARRPDHNLNHLRLLHDRIVECRDSIDAMEIY
jgi:hypothetical protein